MSVLDIKLRRDLYRTKGMMLAIAGIITTGIMALVTLQSAYLNLESAKQSYYKQCRMADFWIDVKKIPLVDVERLSRIPGISEVHPRIRFTATVDLENAPQSINGLVVSLPDQRRHILNDIVIRQGDYFSDEMDNQVIVNEKFARTHGLYPGQTIHLLLNQRRQPLFIIGTAISSEFTYLLGPGAIMPDPEQFGAFYVKRTFAEDVFSFQGAANQIIGRFSPATQSTPDAILEQAANVLDEYGVFATTKLKEQASNQMVDTEIDGLGEMSKVVPAIFLIVAALILNVLMTRLARQQRTTIGTLKAIGYGDLQIFFHFLQLGLAVGIVGGLLGSLLGYVAAAGMTLMYRGIYEFPDLRSGFHWQVMLIGMTTSIACAVFGSLMGARSALRLQPAEAMRPAPPTVGRRVILEKIQWFWSLQSTAWRMSWRSMLRNPLRSGIAIFASAMGGALLITGLMLFDSQNYMVSFQYDLVARSDVDLALADESTIDVLNEARKLPAVDLAEPRLDVSCTLYHGPYHEKTVVTGLVAQPQLTVPYGRDGERIAIPNHGLVLGRRMAEKLHLRLGDHVTMVPTKGKKLPVQIAVVQIADGYLGVASYANIQFLSQQIGEAFVLNTIQLKLQRNKSAVAHLRSELKNLPSVKSVQDQDRIEATLKELLLKVQWIFILALTGFAGTIFFGSILNASLVNLAERNREVATFLAIGYSPFQVGGLFLRESMVLTLVGATLGIPIGFGLAWLTVESMQTDLLRLPVVFRPYLVAIELVCAVVFGLLAHIVVQRTISRMSFQDALKVKE